MFILKKVGEKLKCDKCKNEVEKIFIEGDTFFRTVCYWYCESCCTKILTEQKENLSKNIDECLEEIKKLKSEKEKGE